MQKRLIRVASVLQIANDYGFHPNTVYSWLGMGLPFVRKGRGGKILIPVVSLEKFLEANYQGGPARKKGLRTRRQLNGKSPNS